jgi:hypothetical protein
MYWNMYFSERISKLVVLLVYNQIFSLETVNPIKCTHIFNINFNIFMVLEGSLMVLCMLKEFSITELYFLAHHQFFFFLSVFFFFWWWSLNSEPHACLTGTLTPELCSQFFSAFFR